jgi:hypothetical protein
MQAAMLLTLPGLSVTTPPAPPSSMLWVLLTELSLLGGGGGGPFLRARTANDWLRPTGLPSFSGLPWQRASWLRPGRRVSVA